MSDTDSAAYTATFKAGGGYSDPWLVIRAGSAEQLHDRIKAINESALFATIGSAAKDMQGAYQLGHKLGGEPVNPPKEPAKTKGKSAAKSQPKAEPAKTETESPWEAEPSLVKEEPKAAPAAAPSTTGRPKPAWKK